MSTVDRVRELITPILQSHGVELYDLEHASGTLRVLVDRDGGIDVDTIGDVSNAISAALDAEDPVPDAKYLLEVSSPGVERPLRTPDHFKANISSQVSMKVKPDVYVERRFIAELTAANDSSVEVTIPGAEPPASLQLSYDQIESARIYFDWDAQTQPKKTPNQPIDKKVAAR